MAVGEDEAVAPGQDAVTLDWQRLEGGAVRVRLAGTGETGSLVPAVVILIAMAGGGWIWYRARAGAEPAAAPEITRTGGRE